VIAALYKTHFGPIGVRKAFLAWTFILHLPWASAGPFVLLCSLADTHQPAIESVRAYQAVECVSGAAPQRGTCLTSGLLLTGTLYLVHAEDISRAIVLVTIGLVTLTLSVRRLIGRLLLYRNFERGVGTRNVLIVGTGPEAAALRLYLESVRHLGYRFKGFIEVPGSGSTTVSNPGDVIGALDTLFQHFRRLFVDEVFFTNEL